MNGTCTSESGLGVLAISERVAGDCMRGRCGGCMINRKEMLHRIAAVKSAGVPMVNYGVLIAYLHGILERALASFAGAGILAETRAQHMYGMQRRDLEYVAAE